MNQIEHFDDKARHTYQRAEEQLAEAEALCQKLRPVVEAGRTFFGMLEKLEGDVAVSPSSGQQNLLREGQDFSQLTLVNAVRVCLEEIGVPLKPEKLAEELVKRGFESGSQHLTTLVRQTLNRRRLKAEQRDETPLVIRMNGGWGLPEWKSLRPKEDHPNLHKRGNAP